MNRKSMLKLKAAISLALLIDFCVVMITGIILYVHGSSTKASMLHTVSGFLMGVIAALHILLNFKMLIGEIKGKIEIRFTDDDMKKSLCVPRKVNKYRK